jgi:signal transduction histidine kinase
MLNISRIESGRLTLSVKEVNIDKVVQEVMDDLKPRAAELGVNIVMQADSPPPSVLADRDKIKEVLFNLIGNSLKFTPSGGKITIAFKISDPMVEIKIADTGSGIDAENLPKLFQKFGLLPGSYKQGVAGTGLGLYI